MDIFSLVGKITVNYADAVRNIDQVSDAADDAADNLGDMADAADDADRPIRNTGDAASDADGKFTVWKATLSNLAATVIQNLVSKCGELAVGVLEASANAQAMNSQFSQVFGDMESQASSDLSAIADSAGMMENRMKGSYTQIAAFAKTTGMDTSDALDLANRSMVAVADSAAFYDRSLEETTESLQSFLKGNYENDAALGLSCTETTRNAAANELYGKSFNDLSEAQKQLTLLKMVEDANAASGALGQAARESDTWTNQTGNLQQAWTDFKAVVGSNFLDIAVQAVKKLADVVQGLADKVPGVIQWFNEYKGVLAGVAAVIGIVTTAYGLFNTVQAIKSAMNAAEVTSLGALVAAKWADVAATAAMLAPYIAIVAAIAAVAAGVIYCYNHFETFRNIVNGVAEWIQTNLVAAFEFLKPYIEAIVSAVGELVSAIGDRLMQAFTWIVTKITEVYNSSSPIVQAIKTLFTAHFENIKTVITTVFNVIKTVVSTVLTVIRQIIQTVTAAINGDWSGVWNGIKSIFSTIWNAIKSIVTTVINGVKSVISNTLNAIKSVVSSVLNSIKSVFSSAWNGIKSTVSNVINRIKSTISNGLNAAKSTVTNVLNSIKNAFSNILNGAKNIVSNAINAIKSKFNFSWSLPKLKLPHVKISGSFSLTPPSVPHFSIDWYKKAMDEGMIMNQPTIFGYNAKSNQFMAGGEAGSETVVGTESLMEMIRAAVGYENEELIERFETLISILNDFFPAVLEAMARAIVLDSGALVGELAPAIDDELGQIYRRKGR